mmetsp:Transcript_5187/g.19434  ORF Transcript_5187/g.19434 Transcript_5187/m.19434 type:complete len:133 (+) Transcript_5187:775-1173(+)
MAVKPLSPRTQHTHNMEEHHNPHINAEEIRKSAHGIKGQPHTTPDTSKHFKDVFAGKKQGEGQQEGQKKRQGGRAKKMKKQAELQKGDEKKEFNAEDLGEEWKHPYSPEYLEGIEEIFEGGQEKQQGLEEKK